ncbi:hypothetical protein MGYG_04514 [Nannizzia gypsea CBS 118893]|uniref:Uncharacterized protein n=1 Tax=Arthroderma gypseum (strain ATCC MYA-4604 / CBS 118893) TaxID=535722 RepID=E4UTG1_ARTGP|nr:hypothetical protein MGYG_04514 [Nannizzia gypsea CBS 118893]EFR01506.1 hypothetical protein MGYG_04514 [Nannizzia gypsea CBS 118893]
MADNQEHVANAVQIQKTMDYGSGPGDLPGMADIAVAQIKASAMFAHPWQQLLGSAPVAINSTGLAFVAATSDTAATIELDPPKGGFQYLHYKSLRANLTECGDMGTKAFLAADGGMLYIHSVASMIPDRVNGIMEIIIDPISAQRMLKGALLSIKKSADDCYDRAKTIDKGFNDWMLYATELYACCVQKESTAEEQLSKTKLQMLAAQNILKTDEVNVKNQKEATRTFKKQLQMASSVYKKASDDFPSGWDLVGQEIVGKLGDTVITALGQLATAYTENMNYTARAEEAEKMFKDFNKKGGNDNGSGNTPLPTPEPKAKVPLPQDSTDPAYVQIKPAIVYLRVLYSILFKGQGGGINWDEVSTTTGSGSKSLLYTLQMLKNARDQFIEVATDKDPSVKFKSVLQTSIQIATEVYNLGGKGSMKDLPGPEDEKVKKWQQDFNPAYNDANELFAVSKALPGSTGTETIMANPNKQKTQDPEMAQGQAVLEAAKDRLHTTQQAYTSSLKAYQDATKALTKDQSDLAAAQNRLLELNTDEKNLTAIKTILEASIRLIAVVKTRVMDLVTFFNSISLTIEVIVEEVVEDFLRKIQENVANNDPDGELDDLKVGNYNFTDLARTQIYKSAIFMRAYFEVFGEVAKMWSDLSVQSIMPGIQLLNSISSGIAGQLGKDPKESRDQVRNSVSQLNKWFTDAKANIENLAGTEQKKILEQMDTRIQKIAEDTTKLPPPTETTAKAINAGAAKVTDAAKNAIEFNADKNPMAVWVKK